MLIRTSNINKVFRSGERENIALNNINLGIEKGEFISILGPTGGGKSTLLNILGLLDNPTSGKIYFLGKDVSNLEEIPLTKLRRGNIGLVFQGFNLIDGLSLYENIELPLFYLNYSFRKRKQRTNEVLKKIKLYHLKKYLPKQLSDDQLQKAAIARALVTKPRIILADEPTGNLDSFYSEEIITILSEINEEGITIVLATHMINLAEKARRIIHLNNGKVITQNLKI